jgi:hypothetical protein
VDLHKLLVDRRRMWTKCESRVKPGEGTAEITIAFNPAVARAPGIAKGVVLYAFEETGAASNGQYLGEFSVTNAGDKQITIVPTSSLSQREIDKLKRSKATWALYEIMPSDSHEVFASLNDEQKKAMLPAASLREYLKDGKPAEKGDPASSVVDGKFVRPLVDYRVLFADEQGQRLLLASSIRAAQNDKQLLRDALADAQTQEETCKKNIEETLAAKKGMERDRNIVADLRQKLETGLNAMEAWIDDLTKTNKAMAGQIAKYQLEAAQRIDQRTRAMAQSGAGRL